MFARVIVNLERGGLQGLSNLLYSQQSGKIETADGVPLCAMHLP